MDHAWDQPPPDPFAEPSSRWRGLWLWLPLVVGLVALEVTGNPMLGVALACVRFGERDARTAAWLLRRDRGGVRGRACAAFHVAWGFARVGMMSIYATMLAAALVIAVDAVFKLPVRGLLEQVRGALLTAMGAAVGFLVASYFGLAAALIGRAKAWVSSSNHRAREARTWPPVPDRAQNPEANRVLPIVALASLLTALTVFLAVAFRLPNQAQNFVNLASAFMLFGVFGNLLLLVALAPRISASSPGECWADLRSPASRGPA